MRDKLNLGGKGGAGNERRNQLRAELDEIRGQQSTGKLARGKVIEQLNSIEENIRKKVSTP